VALRQRSLYHAQVASKRDSGAHRDDLIFDVLRGVPVGHILVRDRQYVAFERNTPMPEIIQKVAASSWQDAFPVLGADGKLAGVISSEILRTLASNPDLGSLAIADDMMVAPLSVQESDDLHFALEAILKHGVRELLVTDDELHIVGFLDETEITSFYHAATGRRSVTASR
jgi:CIC family chloride channel protein